MVRDRIQAIMELSVMCAESFIWDEDNNVKKRQTAEILVTQAYRELELNDYKDIEKTIVKYGARLIKNKLRGV